MQRTFAFICCAMFASWWIQQRSPWKPWQILMWIKTIQLLFCKLVSLLISDKAGVRSCKSKRLCKHLCTSTQSAQKKEGMQIFLPICIHLIIHSRYVHSYLEGFLAALQMHNQSTKIVPCNQGHWLHSTYVKLQMVNMQSSNEVKNT